MESMRFAISEPKIACGTFGIGSRSARILTALYYQFTCDSFNNVVSSSVCIVMSD
jgi:hypothetical protein